MFVKVQKSPLHWLQIYICCGPYISSLQASLSGLSSLCPLCRVFRRLMAGMPVNGVLPQVKISHTVTPNDHWTHIRELHHTHTLSMVSLLANHISGLGVDVILDALRSHPPDGHLLLTPCHTLSSTEVVGAIHVLCQSKISHFDHPISVNPGLHTITLTTEMHQYWLLLTCSFWLQGRGEQTSAEQGTPSPLKSDDTCSADSFLLPSSTKSIY